MCIYDFYVFVVCMFSFFFFFCFVFIQMHVFACVCFPNILALLHASQNDCKFACAKETFKIIFA